MHTVFTARRYANVIALRLSLTSVYSMVTSRLITLSFDMFASFKLSYSIDCIVSIFWYFSKIWN